MIGDERATRGFTMLELMIVITIIVILASVTVPLYYRSVLHAREAVLRQNLHEMRKLLDQYATDKQKLPESLEDLVSAGYLKEVPEDPITGEREWETVLGDDPFSDKSASGVVDVKSRSTETSSEGTSYNEW